MMVEINFYEVIGLIIVCIVFILVLIYANLPTKWTLPNKGIDYDFVRNCELLSLKEPEMKKLVPVRSLHSTTSNFNLIPLANSHM